MLLHAGDETWEEMVLLPQGTQVVAGNPIPYFVVPDGDAALVVDPLFLDSADEFGIRADLPPKTKQVAMDWPGTSSTP